MQPDVLSKQESAGVVKAALALDKQGTRVVAELAAARAYKEKHGTLAGWQVGVPASLYRTLQQIDQKAQRERIEALKAHGIQPHHLKASEHASVYTQGLDAIANGRGPNVLAKLREVAKTKQNPEKWCATVARRDTTKQNAKVLAESKEHPVMQTIEAHDAGSKTLHKGTMAGSLQAVSKQYTLAQRVAQLERDSAATKQQMAAIEQRLCAAETSIRWHAVALGMRDAGAGAAVIAKTTGQKLGTVCKFLKRNP